MIGSVCLVIPISFINNGVLSCAFYMCILSLIQYKTSELCINFVRKDDHDFETMI